MTSFGCNEVHLPGWNPSFRVQGQVFHQIGSLLPQPDQPSQFLQDYFIDNHHTHSDQQSIYTTFMSLVEAGQGGMVFVDAPGGTGKTYLMNLILSTVRSHGHIALATASSDIAATMLTGGRTLHSTFKIPLNVTGVDTPMCVQLRGEQHWPK